MKQLLLIFLSVFFIRNFIVEKSNNKTVLEGNYVSITIDGNETCKMTIEIQNYFKGNYKYKLKTEKRDLKGRLQLSFDQEEYIVYFKGIKFSEPRKGFENEYISASVHNDTIKIQNYGNSMNNYVQINECDQKFIYLVKDKNHR